MTKLMAITRTFEIIVAFLVVICFVWTVYVRRKRPRR